MLFKYASGPSRRHVLIGAVGGAFSSLAFGGCNVIPGLSGSYTFSLGLTAVAKGVSYTAAAIYRVDAYYANVLNTERPWVSGGLRGPTLFVDAGAAGTLLIFPNMGGTMLPYPTLAASLERIPFLLPLAKDPTIVPNSTDLSQGEWDRIALNQEYVLCTRPLSLLAVTRRLPPRTPIPYNLYPPLFWLPDKSKLNEFTMLDVAHAQELTRGAISSVQMDISPAHGNPDQSPDPPWIQELVHSSTNCFPDRLRKSLWGCL